MPLYYLETSSLLKRYIREDGTLVMNALFDRKLPNEIFSTSYFTTVEVEAATSRALKAKTLRPGAYRVILGRFSEDLREIVGTQPVTGDILLDATEQARRHGLRAGDAVHMATALLISRGVPTVTIMVTSDNEVTSAATREGMEVLDPRQPDAVAHLRRLRH